MAEPMDEIVSAGGADQRRQRVEGRAEERAQCPRLGAHLFRRACAHETQQPRSDYREIAPAQR
jgi:hypothetical protein